jgi:hypothetical protein
MSNTLGIDNVKLGAPGVSNKKKRVCFTPESSQYSCKLELIFIATKKIESSVTKYLKGD